MSKVWKRNPKGRAPIVCTGCLAYHDPCIRRIKVEGKPAFKCKKCGTIFRHRTVRLKKGEWKGSLEKITEVLVDE